ncbi:hypothetical protein MKX01_020925 [Papaver californicum]|nr:hypothetical protein MKX01_021785 [Papaver californicum]KAI3955104.1 hypothetical protein MKX01_020925 [Papaver californicum]
MNLNNNQLNPQSAAETAVSVIGFGYDLTNDIRLSYCKPGPFGLSLIDLHQNLTRELVFPGGTIVPNRTRFRSEIVSFHQFHRIQIETIYLELPKKRKDEQFIAWQHGAPFSKSMRPIVFHTKEDIVSIHVRRGGTDNGQSHDQWLPTISQSPDVISMSLVPITSLLNGVRCGGFLSHAVNLYLRCEYCFPILLISIRSGWQFVEECSCYHLSSNLTIIITDKPPLEDLHQFLEFQLSRQWAPVYADLPLRRQHKKQSSPSLQFTFMGPKLYVNTDKVDSGNHPVTGIRLFLEGRKSDHLAIHLQHLSTLPNILHLSHECSYEPKEGIPFERDYYEPVKWSLFSHVCTAPIEYNSAQIYESASIVTKAWFEVRDMGMKRVLFLRLGFSMVASARIRRSEWDGDPLHLSRKSGSISLYLSTKFSVNQIQTEKPKVELNSAVYPGGPPAPAKVTKVSKFVDVKEMVRGPEDPPGYWVVTGTKLCVDGGKIALKVKYSLLSLLLHADCS